LDYQSATNDVEKSYLIFYNLVSAGWQMGVGMWDLLGFWKLLTGIFRLFYVGIQNILNSQPLSSFFSN
jgi:hypothetical protein